LAARLCPDPLGELKRSPRPLAAVKGLGTPGGEWERGREGKEGRGERREGKGRGGREGIGGERRRDGKGGGEEVHNLRKTTPCHQMVSAGYGPDRVYATLPTVCNHGLSVLNNCLE